LLIYKKLRVLRIKTARNMNIFYFYWINPPYKTLSNGPAQNGDYGTSLKDILVFCFGGIPGIILRSYSKLLVHILKEVA